MSADRITPIPPEIESKYSRPISEGAQRHLGVRYPVLDHGYVALVDYMGNDRSIVEAARVSYQGGTKSTSSDRDLIRYLYRNAHTSPFEMAELKFQMRMPLFVARQIVRHRTASINEESARYSIMREEFYKPELSVISTQSSNNKQGRGEAVSEEYASVVQEKLDIQYGGAYGLYSFLLNDESSEDYDPDRPNIARELSRVTLPVAVYTSWVWKCDLHNILHFSKLRMDPHAQYEVREYANTMATIIKDAYPIVWEAFEDYKLNAINFSAPEQRVLAILLQDSEQSFDEISALAKSLGLTNKRELSEFLDKLKSLGMK